MNTWAANTCINIVILYSPQKGMIHIDCSTNEQCKEFFLTDFCVFDDFIAKYSHSFTDQLGTSVGLKYNDTQTSLL